MRNVAWEMLQERGVDLDGLAKLVLELQRPYDSTLTLDDARQSLRMVLAKREVQHAVITGVTLDMMAEEGSLKEPLGEIIRENHRLFAIDEVLALSIINIYGSISLSNFGFLGEERPEDLGGARPEQPGEYLPRRPPRSHRRCRLRPDRSQQQAIGTARIKGVSAAVLHQEMMTYRGYTLDAFQREAIECARSRGVGLGLGADGNRKDADRRLPHRGDV